MWKCSHIPILPHILCLVTRPAPEEVKIPCKVPYFPALPEETLRFTGFPQPFSPSSHSPVWLNSGAEPL